MVNLRKVKQYFIKITPSKAKYREFCTIARCALLSWVLAFGCFVCAAKAQAQSLPERADALSKKGHAFFDKGATAKRYFDTAIAWHWQSLALRQQFFGENSIPSANSLTNIGLCFFTLENWDTATFYYKKALDVQENIKPLPPEQPVQIGDSYRCLSHCFFQKGDFLTARLYAAKALDWLVVSPHSRSSTFELAAAYNEWGQCLRYLGDTEGAMKALKKAIAIAPKQDVLNHAAYLTNLGSCYADKQADSAIVFFKKALQIQEQRGQREEKAKILIKIGDFYTDAKQLPEAEGCYQKALQGFDTVRLPFLAATCWTNLAKIAAEKKDFDTALGAIQTALRLLSFKAGVESNYPLETLIALTEYAKMLSETAFLKNTASDWANTLLAYETAIQFGETYEKHIKTPQSALILRGYFYDRYGRAAETCAHLGNFDPTFFEKALAFAERGKAFLLKTNQQAIPYPQLLRAIRQQHVNKTVIAYCFGQKNLIAFYITPTDFKTYLLPTTGLKEAVQSLYGTISAPFESNINRAFVEEASFLYAKLLSNLPLSAETDWVIVPDGILHYLPFDVLLKQKPPPDTPWADYDYVLRHHAIQYQSAAFLPIPQKAKAAHPFLAFAPTFNKHPMAFLNPLRYNGQEIDSINHIWRGVLWKGQNATKQAFIEQAMYYQCLHLSTHGIAYDIYPEQSFLAFSPVENNTAASILTVQEIESLDLHADMVVLSACQTATGAFYGGEGLMSLSRGFLAAGGRSVVASLWRVDELQTMNLLLSFYENLDKGATKSEALRQAKLSLIQKSPMAAYPYFWAAFTVTGDDVPLNTSYKFWLKYGLGGLGLVVLIWVGYRLKKYQS